MPPRSPLTETPPFAVESVIKTLGANLRTARLRRNLTMTEVADKLGVGRHVISDAENGKPGTAIAVYVGMLWTMNLLDHLERVADPAADEVGLARSIADGRERAGRGGGLDNDF